MKRLPKMVLVNGQPWRVTREPLAHLGLDGLCRPGAREIHIDSDLQGDERDETFLHELMHACLREAVPAHTEEKLVTRLAPRLLAALRSAGWVRS